MQFIGTVERETINEETQEVKTHTVYQYLCEHCSVGKLEGYKEARFPTLLQALPCPECRMNSLGECVPEVIPTDARLAALSNQ